MSECTCGKVEEQKMVWDLLRGCNGVKIDNLDQKTTLIVAKYWQNGSEYFV